MTNDFDIGGHVLGPNYSMYKVNRCIRVSARASS